LVCAGRTGQLGRRVRTSQGQGTVEPQPISEVGGVDLEHPTRRAGQSLDERVSLSGAVGGGVDHGTSPFLASSLSSDWRHWENSSVVGNLIARWAEVDNPPHSIRGDSRHYSSSSRLPTLWTITKMSTASGFLLHSCHAWT